MEKKIEEMAIDLRKVSEKVQDRCDEIDCRECGLDPFGKIECKYLARAKMLLEKGYRKQVQGDWVKPQFLARTGFYTLREFTCNQCNKLFEVVEGNEFMNFCPNCGAIMKGK